MKEKKYTPINCSLYDQLEAFAVQKSLVTIEFEAESNMEGRFEAVFKNFRIKENVEFGEILINNQSIWVRLDHIKTINGVRVKDEFGTSCSMPNG